MATFTSLKGNVSQNVAAKITDTESGSFVNQALSQIWASYDWSYKLADQVVATVKDYTTGTVSPTQGSATLIGSGTTWTSSMVARWLRVGSSGDLYKITGFTDTTHLTIESPQGGTGYQAASSTGNSYVIFQHVFELASDTYRVLLPSRQYSIRETTRDQIDRVDPWRTSSSSNPLFFAPRELSANNNYQIELWPRPNVAGIFRVPYLKNPPSLVNGTDDSLIRGDVIEHLASFKASMYLLAKFGDEKYRQLAQGWWMIYNGGKGDTDGGSLSQAITQDQLRYGSISHVRDASRGVALSDEFLAAHDLAIFGGGGEIA